jgi:hypothetical protein
MSIYSAARRIYGLITGTGGERFARRSSNFHAERGRNSIIMIHSPPSVVNRSRRERKPQRERATVLAYLLPTSSWLFPTPTRRRLTCLMYHRVPLLHVYTRRSAALLHSHLLTCCRCWFFAREFFSLAPLSVSTHGAFPALMFSSSFQATPEKGEAFHECIERFSFSPAALSALAM